MKGIVRTQRLLWQVLLLALWMGLVVGLAPVSSNLAAEEDAAEASWLFTGGSPQDVDDLKVLQRRLQELSRRIAPATVGLRLGPVEGSGVIVNKEGYILTAAHVIGAPNQDVLVILPDGRQVRGVTLGMNRSIDAGLLRITETPPSSAGWPYAETGTSRSVRSGQWCVATGHPGGFQRERDPVLRLGRILSKDDEVLVTDCTLVGGDSGGPLFDMKGHVIAIHSRIGTPLTANLHVPVDGFRESWDRMVRKEAWGALPGFEPFIGVQAAQDANDARVAYVYPGAPAEVAGVRVGDVIVAVDDEPIGDFADLIAKVNRRMPGDRVILQVRRRNTMLELEVTIGRRSDYQE